MNRLLFFLVTLLTGKALLAQEVLTTRDSIITGQNVVITATRQRETMLRAPVAISVISGKDLAKQAGGNVYETFTHVAGLQFTRSGVDGITLNARGFHSAFNNKVMQVIDNRLGMAPLSGGLALFNNGTTVKEDIDRIEVVLGPQSTLYGPNAENAVVHMITKHPGKYAGTDVALSAGNHYQFSTRLRQAGKIMGAWLYKLTGERSTGKDFTFYDSVYAGGAPSGPAVSIPERNVDFNFQHLRGEGHLYFIPASHMEFELAAGTATNDWLQETTAMRNQMRGTTYSFIHARSNMGNLFMQVYKTWGGIGKSYAISSYTRDYWNSTHRTTAPLSPDSAEVYAMRYGNRFHENSSRINADLQYSYQVKKVKLSLLGGLMYQQEDPNGYGVNLVDGSRKIRIKQYGGFLQADQQLPANMRLLIAARLDHHSALGSFFSPKFALQKKVGKGYVRVNWGRAYTMPSILNQFAGINGFLFGNGEGVTYIPVGTNVKASASLMLTTPLKPEKIDTWEAGYRGLIAKNLFLDVNGYYGQSKNYISPARTVAGRALFAGEIPVVHNPSFAGIVVNDTLRNASFTTFFNYGQVDAYGIDLSLEYQTPSGLHAWLTYSRFGSDITKKDIRNDANKDGYVSAEEISLNAPVNQFRVAIRYTSTGKQAWYAGMAARHVDKYDFYSGSQIGTEAGANKRGVVSRGNGLPPILKNYDHGALGGFTTLDLDAGSPLNKYLSLGISIQNLLDTRQVEFVGSPSIGRLMIAELRIHL